jgi:hypothetical protein
MNGLRMELEEGGQELPPVVRKTLEMSSEEESAKLGGHQA